MGTSNKPTQTTSTVQLGKVTGISFGFKEDLFFIAAQIEDNGEQGEVVIEFDLSDDELQQLEMVAFAERQARFFRDMRNFQGGE